MSKVILLIFALQFLLSIQHISTAPSRSACYVSDDDSDEDHSSGEENDSDSDNEDESSSDENEDGSEIDDDEEPPHFNCILFGDRGCDATCSSLASLYNASSQGTCDTSHICQCTLQSKTLNDLWNEKFLKDDVSKNLLQKITKDAKLRQEVHDILLEFPRTVSESILQLKERFPKTAEYDKLKPNDKLKMPISKHIDQSDRLDHKSLRKYLSSQILKSLKKGDFAIDNVDYKSNIESFLKEDDSSLPLIINNKNFAKFLSKLFPENMIEESIEEDTSVSDEIPDFVESVVIEQFVKYLEDKKKSGKKEKKESQKKEKKESQKKEQKESQKIDTQKSDKKSVKKSDEDSKDKKPLPLTKPSKTSLSTDEKEKWSTPGLEDFTSINDHKTLNKKWKTDTVDVTLIKNKNRSIKLDWKKQNTTVILHKQSDGSIKQTWQFGDEATIKLDLNSDGSIKQHWKIGDKTMQYSKPANDSGSFSGNVTKKDLAIYKHEIKTWCQENRKLFNVNDCIIFNKV